jgi:hypothetical protein
MKRMCILAIGLAVAMSVSPPALAQLGSEETCYSAPDTCRVCYAKTSGGYEIVRLDLGSCDTVRLGCPIEVSLDTLTAGDSIAIPIFMWNDYPLGGISLGFRHNGTGLQFGGNWKPALISEGGVFTALQAGDMLYVADSCTGMPECKSALIGWVDMSAHRPIPANTSGHAKLLGDIYLRLVTPSPQVVTIDSAYHHPSGLFILVSNYSTRAIRLTPQFQACSGVTIRSSAPACGDVDANGSINIADVVYLLHYLFVDGDAPDPLALGEVNCDAKINIADVIYLVNYVFRAGLTPCAACE